MHEHHLPPLNWLRAFEASARHLSFTSAAGELNLTQAAISKQIRLLELQLGEPLFIRLPRSLKLTKAGEAFLPKVQDAFARLSAGTREVFGGRKAGVITVRVAIGFGVNWLASRLPDFIEKHPDIHLRLISSVWNEDDDGRTHDIDIRYGDGSWKGVRSERLTHEMLVPVCSSALLATGALARPADLSVQPLIHVLGYKEGWDLWLKSAGLKFASKSQGIQCDTSLMAFGLAAAGAGVALGRTSMVAAELKSGRLVAPFDLAVPVEEGFHLVMPEQLAGNVQAEAFRHWILGESKTDPD